MSDVEESAGDESVSESGDESNDDVESDASASDVGEDQDDEEDEFESSGDSQSDEESDNDETNEEDLNDEGDYNYADSDDVDDDNRADVNNVAKDANKGSCKKKFLESETESSSSDDNDEKNPKCPVCLHRLTNRKIACPSSGCIHSFCLDCLREWSKNSNTCPIDRSEFDEIIIKASVGGKEISRERVVKGRNKENDLPPDFVLAEDLTLCEVCGSGDREESLLLCDACDLGFHLECCVPPMENVPRGRWYCQTCSMAGLVSDYIRHQRRREAASLAIGSDDEDDDVVLPRTMEMERVRRAVRQRRGEEHDQLRRTSESAASSATSPKKRQTKKRRKTTRRKTTKRRKTGTTKKRKSGTSKKRKSGTTKRRKSGSAKKRKSTKRRTKRKTKGRRKRKDKSGEEKENRSERGENFVGPGLSIYGDVNDLDFYGDEDLFVNPVPSTSSGLAKPVNFDQIKPSNEPVNLLADLIACQTNFLTRSKPEVSKKRNEVYTKPDINEEEKKIISTSVSRGLMQQKLKEEKEREKRKIEKEKSKIKPTEAEMKSLLKEPRRADDVDRGKRGVSFSNVDQVSFVPENKFPSAPKKIEFKIPSSSGLASFKIPLKRKSTASSSSATATTLQSCSSSGTLPNESKPSKIVKFEGKIKEGKDSEAVTKKCLVEDSLKTKSLGQTVSSSNGDHDVRKLRIAHFEKLGFKDGARCDDSKPALSQTDSVKQEILAASSSRTEQSCQNIRSSTKADSDGAKQLPNFPHIKKENIEHASTTNDRLKREPSLSSPKSDPPRLSSLSDRKRNEPVSSNGSIDRKRKFDESVKVFFNGKEVKIPKMSHVKIDPDDVIRRREGSSPKTDWSQVRIKQERVETFDALVGYSDVKGRSATLNNGCGRIKLEKEGKILEPNSNCRAMKKERSDADEIRSENDSNDLATKLSSKIKKEKLEQYNGAQSTTSNSDTFSSKFSSTVKQEPNDRSVDQKANFKSQNGSQLHNEPEGKFDAGSKVSTEPKTASGLHDHVAAIAKEFLKPFFVRNVIDKDTYKIIMKKSVQKILTHESLNLSASSSATSLIKDINKDKVKRLVEAYVEKYKR